MKNFTQKVLAFVRDEEGLTMTEYAVAGSLVTVLAAAAFTNLGNAIVNAINVLIDNMAGGA